MTSRGLRGTAAPILYQSRLNRTVSNYVTDMRDVIRDIVSLAETGHRAGGLESIRRARRARSVETEAGYNRDGALKAAFATGDEYVKWVQENEQLHKDLMAKGGLLKQ